MPVKEEEEEGLPASSLVCKHTDRQADRQTGRQTGRQKD